MIQKYKKQLMISNLRIDYRNPGCFFIYLLIISASQLYQLLININLSVISASQSYRLLNNIDLSIILTYL